MAYTVDDELLQEILTLRREVRLRDGRPNDGRCGNVARRLSERFGWQQQWGYLKLLDSSVSWVHCWNRLPDGTIIDATADQYQKLWLGDVVSVPPDDIHAGNYRHAPKQWELSFEGDDRLVVHCRSAGDAETVRGERWPEVADRVLEVLTGWRLTYEIVDVAARTLRAKATTLQPATTEDLVRPLLTQHIEHLALSRQHPWVADEFADPLE